MINKCTLFDLQRGQQDHDEKAHRDILCLPMERRVKHMTLHFAKYAGKLLQQNGHASSDLEKLVVDVAIIALASANMLNIRLDESIQVRAADAARDDIRDVISALATANGTTPETVRVCIGRDLAVFTGHMAKACESLDHVEQFPSREALEEGVRNIIRLVLVAAGVLRLDLETQIQRRWRQVEKKSVFHFDRAEERQDLLKVG